MRLIWVFLFTCLFTANSPAIFFGKRTAEAPVDTDTIVLVQVYLDELMLGPGIIDGKLGEFTQKAFEVYNTRWKVEPGNWFRVLREAGLQVKSPYTEYTVRPEDLTYVGPLPLEPAEQATFTYMSYRGVAEFVAERFHTTETFLRTLNPGVNLDALQAGQVLRVPNVTPFEIESIRKHEQFSALEPLSARLVFVDTKNRTAKVFEKGILVANFPITPGQEKFIPYGDWTLQSMVATPEFRWDKKMLEEGQRGDEHYQLPPGPNSPVGILWAGLDKSGIGLHGTATPETIGRSLSAGCIRLANWDAIRLRLIVRPGAKVLVR